MAKQAGAADAMLIANKDAISWERADKAGHIGLSAGASAPESLVQDVIHALADRYELEWNPLKLLRHPFGALISTVFDYF